MNRPEDLVIEAARRVSWECSRWLPRMTQDELNAWPDEILNELKALALAVRAMDLAARETWRGEQQDSD